MMVSVHDVDVRNVESMRWLPKLSTTLVNGPFHRARETCFDTGQLLRWDPCNPSQAANLCPTRTCVVEWLPQMATRLTEV